MKFIASTVTASICSVFAAAAATTLNSQTTASKQIHAQRLLSSPIRLDSRNSLTKEMLKRAVPVDGKGNVRARTLQEDGNDDSAFEITSEYSIKFHQCISLTVGPGGNNNKGTVMFDDDLIGYSQTGKIVNEKSYVIINVCSTVSGCSASTDETSSDLLTYMVEIGTYMKVLANYYENEQQLYCAACASNTDYCEYVKEQEAKYASYYKQSKYEQATMAESQYAGTGYYTDSAASSSSSAYQYKYGSYSGQQQQSSSSNSYQYASNSYQQQQQQQYSNGYQQNGGNYYNGNPYQNQYSNGGYQQQGGYQNGYNNYGNKNGNRNLAVDMSTFKVLNCTKCDELLCDANTDDKNNNAAADDTTTIVDMATVTEWIESMAECRETGETLFDGGVYPLYSGFMCNEDGSGIEVALFLDEDCITYTSLESWQTYASEQYDVPILSYAKNVLTYPTIDRNDITCSATTNYVNQDMYNSILQGYDFYANNGDNNNNNKNNDNNNEASEFCRDMFEGEGENAGALSLSTCQGGRENNNNNNNNNYNVGVDADGKEYVIAYQDYYYPWFTYLVSQENSRDARDVCHIVRALNGEYVYVYDSNGSGSLYHSAASASSSNSASHTSALTHYAQVAREKMSPMIITIVVCTVLASLLAFFCIIYSCCCKSSVPNQYSDATEAVREKRQKRSPNSGMSGGVSPPGAFAGGTSYLPTSDGSVSSMAQSTGYYRHDHVTSKRGERLVDAATGTLA